MSRHEGVSCDQCLKSNFRGKRYKCLICYDYDLCATCFEAGATTTRHTTEHPMQCILTRTDFDLYYGGEALSLEQPQSFTCPFCGKMGYNETTLHEHITAEHSDSSIEVVCPICASLPGGDPNLVTDDFAGHLTLEHRAPRDLDEPMGGFRHVRRIQHPGRGVGGTRTRRTNMHFQSAGGALSGLSPSSRETMDPIAGELLSQLSSVRSRAAAAQSVSSQLQQLEMQLQTTSSRQQLERLPARRQVLSSGGAASATTTTQPSGLDLVMAPSTASAPSTSASSHSQFLLARLGDGELSEMEKQRSETEHADRSLFVQELLLSSLAEGLRLGDSDSEDDCASLDGDIPFSHSLDSAVDIGSTSNGGAAVADPGPGSGDGGTEGSTCTDGAANCASAGFSKTTTNSNHTPSQGATGSGSRIDVIGNSPPRDMVRVPSGGDSSVDPAGAPLAATVKQNSRGRESRERENANKVYKEPSSAKVAH